MSTAVQTQSQQTLPATRFTEEVVRQFQANAGQQIQLTNHQKRLVSSYFVACDQALKAAEEKRAKKRDADPVPITWANVNMPDLAVQVVSCARIGYDPSLPNHIAVIPYKNNTTGKYDITFMEEYRGREIRAKKYGLDVPDYVVVELVYENDTFRAIKKDMNNRMEAYEFTVAEDPFNRGELRGGFYYHGWYEHADKNRLVIFNKAEIDKRKPKYASAEFWGGEKDVWQNGKKTGTEKIEGWYSEMAYKTIYRAAYGAITIDSQKIDDDFIRLSEAENRAEISNPERLLSPSSDANAQVIDASAEVVQEPVKELQEAPPVQSDQPAPKKLSSKETLTPDQPELPVGPNF